jgi:hypothetical protein
MFCPAWLKRSRTVHEQKSRPYIYACRGLIMDIRYYLCLLQQRRIVLGRFKFNDTYRWRKRNKFSRNIINRRYGFKHHHFSKTKNDKVYSREYNSELFNLLENICACICALCCICIMIIKPPFPERSFFSTGHVPVSFCRVIRILKYEIIP